MTKHLLVTLLTVILSVTFTYAQKVDPSWKGTVSGTVWDLEHSTMLRSSTVAIYFSENNELIGYRLTNQYGEFSYTGLPLDVKLKLVASFIGHVSAEKSFLVKSSDKPLELGKLDLPLLPVNLAEVQVNATPPPMRMKGDTLEFYADAFKLDPNAQTEDLLRALPGVTVWSDGEITVNGRSVKGVVVNGKPFFGNEAKIATQNIPKDAVEKIQVYKKDKDHQRLTDSTTEMNIQLKKNKSFGYFGKVGAGLGSSGKYDGDATINFFNRRSKVGGAIARNNVNKVAGNLDFILRNSTYKGPGASVEYQSDFTKEGAHINTAGGLQFQHDFIDKPDYDNNNRLSGYYFLSQDRATIDRSTLSLLSLGDGSIFKQSDVQANTSSVRKYEIRSGYDRKKNNKIFKINASFSRNDGDYVNQATSVTALRDTIPISSNQRYDQGSTHDRFFELAISYRGDNKSNRQDWYSGYSLDNTTQQENKSYQQQLITKYQAFLQPDKNISFDRIYDNNNSSTINRTKIFLPNFAKLFFGNTIPFGMKAGFGTAAKLSNTDFHTIVKDFDTLRGSYVVSPYLTNNRNEKLMELSPYLMFSKNIYRILSNRYEKNFLASFTSELEINSLKSSSQHVFQQFGKNYMNFNPKIDVSYSNKSFGEHISTFSVSGAYTNKYPTVQQLAPLTDSINVNFIATGNFSLRPQRTAELRGGYTFESEDPNNISSWSIFLSGGYANNYFANNYKIDSLGRVLYSTINSDGYRFLRTNLNYKKALKMAQHQIQFSVAPEFSIEHTPNVINDLRYFYNNISFMYDPKISYSCSDWFTVIVSQHGTHQKSISVGNESNSFSSYVSQSELSMSLRIFKKVNVTSSVFYTKNRYNGKALNEFTIWNAAATFRFLKAQNAEIKISGLDLLGQNRGIISTNANNTITQGTVNALKRYAMLSLSYYPRKFGK